jgi:hypothetical protein
MKKFHLIFFTLSAAALPIPGKTAAPQATHNLIILKDQETGHENTSREIRYPSLNKELYLQRTHYRWFLQRL